MDFNIHNKKVLITGASQGIGREIAFAFAKEGCKVCCIARREEKLKELIKELENFCTGHSYYVADLMEIDNPTLVVKELLKNNNNFDIVVHNLGGTLNIKSAFVSFNDWMKVLRFNVGIAIEMNKYLIPLMIEKKWGRIIFISSISGETLRGSAPYSVAKAFLNAYVKVLGRELAQKGIVVSAVMPGAIYAAGGHWDDKNEINSLNKIEFFKKRDDFLRHHQAIGRFGRTDEIASFVVFLASEQASFAIGSLVPIDGGTM